MDVVEEGCVWGRGGVLEVGWVKLLSRGVLVSGCERVRPVLYPIIADRPLLVAKEESDELCLVRDMMR